MRYYESDCHDCQLPCVNNSCPYFRVERFICDWCKTEDVKLYNYNSWEICGDCLLQEFEVIEGSDEWI